MKLSKVNYMHKKGTSLLAFPKDYIVLDIETTGCNPNSNHIIEIGAIKVIDHEIYDTFSMLTKPNNFHEYGRYLNSFIINLTGITDSMLDIAKNIEDVLPLFLDFIEDDSIIVGHNVNFDISFMQNSFDRYLQLPFTNDYVDTLRIARRCKLDVINNKLDTLCSYFGIDRDVSHRGLADCIATNELLLKLKEYCSSNAILAKEIL